MHQIKNLSQNLKTVTNHLEVYNQAVDFWRENNNKMYVYTVLTKDFLNMEFVFKYGIREL